jgi:hypothetical protein
MGRQIIGASVQKEEAGIFRARDAAWATEYLNERVDRPMIRYLFDQEPRAWMAIMPPPEENAEENLKSVQTLVPMGLRIGLKEAYRRFRWKTPAEGEACLQSPLAPHPPGQEGPNHPPPTHAKSALPAPSTAPEAIGAGAEPGRHPQTASLQMPDPQVDDAGFWSGAGGTMPALGYAIPNQGRDRSAGPAAPQTDSGSPAAAGPSGKQQEESR